MAYLAIDKLTKQYDKIEAVTEFSLAVDRGEIYALVGPDGAGKTTLMRSVCNLIRFDSGSIRIDGHDTIKDFNKIKQKLGYMPQTFSLYPDLTVEENLIFYAGIYGVTGREFEKRAERMYSFSNLKPFKNRRAQALSGGMKQKLALSCALMHDPEILVLDEPTTGVDPLSRRQFWEILIDLKKQGVTILVSTPYMDEVARADRACFIFDGKKLAEDKPADLPRLFKGQLFYLNMQPTAERVKSVNQIDGISANRFGAGLHLFINEQERIENYYGALERIGIDQDKIEPLEPGLEDCFIQLME